MAAVIREGCAEELLPHLTSRKAQLAANPDCSDQVARQEQPREALKCTRRSLVPDNVFIDAL
jgi:hypothetical protein